MAGVLPFWRALTRQPLAASTVAGVNATVAGLLGAVLYHPVLTGAIRGPAAMWVSACRSDQDQHGRQGQAGKAQQCPAQHLAGADDGDHGQLEGKVAEVGDENAGGGLSAVQRAG